MVLRPQRWTEVSPPQQQKTSHSQGATQEPHHKGDFPWCSSETENREGQRWAFRRQDRHIPFFTEQVQTPRSSKNRAAGTMVTKAVGVTKETYKKMLIENVSRNNRAKWPRYANNTIWLQQDNARPHNVNDDSELVAGCTEDGFDIRLINHQTLTSSI